MQQSAKMVNNWLVVQFLKKDISNSVIFSLMKNETVRDGLIIIRMIVYTKNDIQFVSGMKGGSFDPPLLGFNPCFS